ncbi:hypothetical protein A2625_03015 [candidate division WOR-1 bacterium RIFCSPHIGHO2_01_FULL_53_15]|uniref:Uncharacterized protein n=1 Tax=candidate division WOR-1 bacterium RIFCSPHIGHO2_01_FULL_53_15 TaxID=1802564 RepID=A0A1F4Q2X1_UNCSA|nr:MAG: hypothetical protein A2625_03015 [candidate division WOR-1 bacterium RIFCSPHIGHO2_01_FULL_53_15]OGC10395.1 MAG: hypothetical protein A3D23_07700 [candidate division WOR-1 bacterium RIFCSPHIGHO2_02_FULL_53_26]
MLSGIYKTARQYLTLPEYTIWRRETRQPVKVSLTAFKDVPSIALLPWANYDSINSAWEEEQRLRPVITLDPDAVFQRLVKSGPKTNIIISLGLVEEQRLLQGFLRAIFGAENRGGGLNTAPWNYSARLMSDKFPYQYFGWTRSLEHEAEAVSGVGWTLKSYYFAFALVLEEQGWPTFPLTWLINEQTDAGNFHAKVLELGQPDMASSQDAARIVRAALAGEESGRPGWQILKESGLRRSL